MCLAIPMQVLEVTGDPDDFTSSQTALVDADALRVTVRLDVIDRWPKPGDYVIVHAGFAIHCLDEEEALKNLALLRELAENTPAELLSPPRHER